MKPDRGQWIRFRDTTSHFAIARNQLKKTLHRDHSFILIILILRTILKMNVKIAEINPIIKTWIYPYQPYQNRLVPQTAIHWSNIYIWSI